jgi:hypothetical protein
MTRRTTTRRSIRTTRTPRTAARPTIRTAGVAAVLVALPLGLSACSGSADAADPGSPDAAVAQVQEQTDVPQECREAFPVAVGKADPADVTLMPATWPTDVVEATLCQTSATGSGIQVASYATDATGPEVLDAVQGALPSSYDVVREDQGMGEQLDGSGDGVSFRVTVREGAYDVMFSEE